ncbi:MAG TPA: ABC transporter ATP-binding protein [Mycobacteriales bacterium]|nr:ABC transporter ATP-binding protein [Mycobacteriales bacterium]
MRHRWILGRYLGPQRGGVTAMAVLLLAGIGLELIEPQFIGRVIQSVQEKKSSAALMQLAALYFAVSMLRRAVTVLATLGSERVAWRATNALRVDLTAHVLRQDPAFYATHSAGELIERIDGDVDQIADFFSTFVVRLLGNALLAIGTVIAVATVSPLVGLLFGVVIVAGTVGLQLVGRSAQVYWGQDRECSARFYGHISESLQATEDLRSSGAAPYALEKYARRVRAWSPVVVRSAAWGSSVWMIATAVLAIASALAYGFGGHLFRSGAISLGDVYLLVAYAAMLSGPMESIQNETQYLQRASAAINRISSLLATRSSIVDGRCELPPGPPTVEFDAVSFRYGADGFALEDVTFHIGAGQTLGLIGRTGAGKSTIAQLVFRLYDPTAGVIRIGGVDLRDLDRKSLRSRIGFVTQDGQLFDATVRENLTFFDESVPEQTLRRTLHMVGLDDLDLNAEISGTTLSAGQVQLIAFARVLLADPGIVILDEPSSRLDPATEARLQRAMDHLLSDRTAIVIAHRLETIRRSDQVLVLDDGRVAEYGEPSALLADGNSRFAELFRTGEVPV